MLTCLSHTCTDININVCVDRVLGVSMFVSAVRILLLLAFNYCSVVTVWPCPALIVTHILPSWRLAEWIPKARLHRGGDPNSLQHCIMGALGPLGALQREHVHRDLRGRSDLRSQTHELSCTLVNTHTHTFLYSSVFIKTTQCLTLLSCVQSHVRAARSLVEGASSAVGRLWSAASQRALWSAGRSHSCSKVLPGWCSHLLYTWAGTHTNMHAYIVLL